MYIPAGTSVFESEVIHIQNNFFFKAKCISITFLLMNNTIECCERNTNALRKIVNVIYLNFTFKKKCTKTRKTENNKSVPEFPKCRI